MSKIKCSKKNKQDNSEYSNATVQQLSADELKSRIVACERQYRLAVQTNSCKEIMGAYKDWQMAKKNYYKSLNVDAPAEEAINSQDELSSDECE